jgi:hypothetical protein
MDFGELKERILTVVQAARDAKVTFDTVEVAADNTITIGSSVQVAPVRASEAPENEDLFEKFMGKGSVLRG